jgi:hypothetical protein
MLIAKHPVLRNHSRLKVSFIMCEMIRVKRDMYNLVLKLWKTTLRKYTWRGFINMWARCSKELDYPSPKPLPFVHYPEIHPPSHPKCTPLPLPPTNPPLRPPLSNPPHPHPQQLDPRSWAPNPDSKTTCLASTPLGLGARCELNSRDCSPGLSCIGLDHRRRCVCNNPKVLRLRGRQTSCRSARNVHWLGIHVGIEHMYVSKCDCENALAPDACGRGRASVSWVTSKKVEIRCGTSC